MQSRPVFPDKDRVLFSDNVNMHQAGDERRTTGSAAVRVSPSELSDVIDRASGLPRRTPSQKVIACKEELR